MNTEFHDDRRDSLRPEVNRVRRAVVVVDVVESVRMMQEDETDFIDRWRALASKARHLVSKTSKSRLVKSLGDGLLLEFETVVSAVQFGFALHRFSDESNVGRPAERGLFLRIGIHTAEIVIDELDIYGHGVNLAARLATLADMGQTVASGDAKDELIAGLDATIEHLGLCYLKHLSSPIDAYRLTPAGSIKFRRRLHPDAVPSEPETLSGSKSVSFLTVAVVDFECWTAGKADLDRTHGAILADRLTALLSIGSAVSFISRLSTRRLTHRVDLDIPELLGASHVIGGQCERKPDGTFSVTIDLREGPKAKLLWSHLYRVSPGDLLDPENALYLEIAGEVAEALLTSSLRKVGGAPLPTIESFSLQHAAISLMHRTADGDFTRARSLLEHLIDRHPRAAEPKAWLAKWYVLQLTTARVDRSQVAVGRALDLTKRAVDADPDCSLALSMQGFVQCHMQRDLDAADACLDLALKINPSESTAHLFKCVVEGFRGEGTRAIASATRAIRLSPLDPQRHYAEGLAASAALAAGDLALAIELAHSSLQLNRDHAPTLRALTIAQVECGLIVEAKETARRVLTVQPTLTVGNYLSSAPRGAESSRLRYGTALGMAGIPL